MNERHYIYRIINTITGDDYIGKRKLPESKSNIEALEDPYMGSGIDIIAAENLYGVENFKKEILEDFIPTEIETCKREIFWIREFKNKGQATYNRSPGGEIGDFREFMTDEEYADWICQKSEKGKKYWQSLSEEEKFQRCLNMKKGWEKMSEKNYENFCQTRSIIQTKVYKNTSEERKQEINSKRKISLKKMHESRTAEQEKEIGKKISKKLKEYNKNISVDKKEEISTKQSEARKNFLLKETPEQREKRSKNQSLAQGKKYKIQLPNNEIIEIRALALWCRETFGNKGNSAATSFLQRKKYKGYLLLGEIM